MEKKYLPALMTNTNSKTNNNQINIYLNNTFSNMDQGCKEIRCGRVWWERPTLCSSTKEPLRRHSLCQEQHDEQESTMTFSKRRVLHTEGKQVPGLCGMKGLCVLKGQKG